MAGKKRKKPMTKFPRRMQKKLLVMFGLIALMLMGLIGRLMYIEYTSGEKYEKIVLSQQEYDSQTIPYQRGDIVDAKGNVLATSIAVYNVILDCSVLTSSEDYIDPTIQALVQCFPELTADQLYGYVREQPESRYIILKKKAAYEEIQPFVEIQEAVDEKGKKINPNVKGVWFEKEYQREYPYDYLASAVIGFTAAGNVGVNGLENYYNDTLNGIDGREYGYLNTDNNFEKTIKPAVNGNNIVSTIDINIQSVVEAKIAEFNEAYTDNYREGDAGATHIGVVIMNPNNGDVLAMANYPNYDLSNPRDLSAYYTEEELAEMDEDTKMDALNQLWQNFCVTYTYEPGSTAKPFTVAAGLETGTLLGTETYYCDGYETVGGHNIHCVNRQGHGMETLEQTLMNSCNDALMQMSYSIGAENFTEYQQIFGFGQKTNVDLPGETRTDSLIYTKDNMTPVDLATNSFGQNFNTSMIQLASAYCSIVNGGELYQPRLVKRITDENGNTIRDISPTLVRQTISEQTGDRLKQYMYSTVTAGTAVTAKVDGYSMGGKTGTAQKAGRDGVNYLVSFIGFAPVEDPQLVIYCVVDEPNAQEQWHSTFAQNITREILEEVLPYMNIYRDEETTGIHYGWDIKGEDSGAVAMTDIVNEETQSEMPVEDGLTDVPDTTDDLPGNQEDAETTVPDVDVGNVGDSDIPPVVTDIPIDNNE
ncbi:MAG: penicillin-binding protein 2 [Clostridiales bacterium]|nr:penicillin-binding protein 2 [Roseburia sp.]MDD7638069.1 penicillin-binding protein 2 [Clostridiales bacterium]MDY4112320.1 penicillin-binding protein 2 [Roseburia sp.]